MEEFIISRDEHINFVIGNFDFAKVYNVMHHLGWTWFGNYDTPTIDVLKENAIILLQNVYNKEDEYSISSGGFKATKGEEYLKLEFIVSELDSSYLIYTDKFKKLKEKKERSSKVKQINKNNEDN